MAGSEYFEGHDDCCPVPDFRPEPHDLQADAAGLSRAINRAISDLLQARNELDILFRRLDADSLPNYLAELTDAPSGNVTAA